MGNEPPRPVCTIFGGANGSGKSTLIQSMAPPGELVNADEIARLIDRARPENASLAAGRMVLERLDELIAERQSFHWETTLSSHQALHYMAKARMAGFQTNLVFVVLENVALNIARVRSRVANGGHDIPEESIKRRYERAFERLPKAIQLSDAVIVYDNTHRNDLRTLYRVEGGTPQYNALDEARMFHARIAKALAAALGRSTKEVFRSARL
jgi:predicted ABC-type ATPase